MCLSSLKGCGVLNDSLDQRDEGEKHSDAHPDTSGDLADQGREQPDPFISSEGEPGPLVVQQNSTGSASAGLKVQD